MPRAATHRVLAWISPHHALWAREAIARAELSLAACGASHPAHRAQVQTALGAPPVSDLRQALASRDDIDLVLLTEPGSLQDSDLPALREAHERGVQLVTTQPVLTNAQTLRALLRLPACVIAGLPADEPAVRDWLEARSPIEEARTCHVQSLCAPDQLSLGALLWGALHLLRTLLPDAETIDAAYAPAARAPGAHLTAPESLELLDGDMVLCIRGATGRVAGALLSNRAAGRSTRVEVLHSGGISTMHAGDRQDNSGESDSFTASCARALRDASRGLAHNTWPSSDWSAKDYAHVMAWCHTALLAARTGQPEHVSTYTRLVDDE